MNLNEIWKNFATYLQNNNDPYFKKSTDTDKKELRYHMHSKRYEIVFRYYNANSKIIDNGFHVKLIFKDKSLFNVMKKNKQEILHEIPNIIFFTNPQKNQEYVYISNNSEVPNFKLLANQAKKLVEIADSYCQNPNFIIN